MKLPLVRSFLFIFLLGMTLSAAHAQSVFPDVSTSHQNYEAIKYLKENNIVEGYGDGTFHPESEINRAEFLKILVESKGLNPVVESNQNCFGDVGTEWFAKYVCLGKNIGWVDGYPDGSYQPGQTVNKVESIKMILNSQDVEVPASILAQPYEDTPMDAWYINYVGIAKQYNLLEETGAYLNPGEKMTRAAVSEIMYRTLMMNSSADDQKPKETTEEVSPETIAIHEGWFSELFEYLFVREIWEDYYPLIAQDEQTALEFALLLESDPIGDITTSEPFFSPFNKFLNYWGSGMAEYELVDSQISENEAIYLFTTENINHGDFSDTTRYPELWCYPMVKEAGDWKIKAARFIPDGIYQTQSLNDSVISSVCRNYIRTQSEFDEADFYDKRMTIMYSANLSFDLYLNGHLIKMENVDYTRPVESGMNLEFPLLYGVNFIKAYTGPYNENNSEMGLLTVELYDEENNLLETVNIKADSYGEIKFNYDIETDELSYP